MNSIINVSPCPTGVTSPHTQHTSQSQRDKSRTVAFRPLCGGRQKKPAINNKWKPDLDSHWGDVTCMSGEEKCSPKLKSGEGEHEFDFCESFQSSGKKEKKSNFCCINRFQVKEIHSLRFRTQRLYAGNINQLISFARHRIQKLRIKDVNFKTSSRAVFLIVSSTFISVADRPTFRKRNGKQFAPTVHKFISLCRL